MTPEGRGWLGVTSVWVWGGGWQEEVELGPVFVEKWKFQQMQRAERLRNLVAFARKHL